MRHKKKHSLNNRFTSWKKATLISLAKNILYQQSIKTTKVKASSAQPLVEKLITLAKADTLLARRKAFAILGEHGLVSTLFKDIGPRFKNRVGGYTRILDYGQRRGDGADMVLFELTEIKKREVKKVKKSKAQEEHQPEGLQSTEEAPLTKQPKPEVTTKEERPPLTKKPTKKFFGGLRSIFKKERDSL
jgi:large subunit ribosomal protein L17